MTDDRAPGSDADAPAFGAIRGWEVSRLARLRARFASPWAGIGFALVAVAVGLTVRWAMNDPGIRFVILYPTVALAALVGGPTAGLAATVTAALAAEFLFFRPVWSSGAAILADSISVANFVLTGLLMSLVAAVDHSETKRMLAGMRRGREVEERHSTVIEALLEGVVVFDGNGAVVAANPSAEWLLGLPLSELRTTFRDIPAWPLTREDGSPLPVEEYPAAQVLRSGLPIHGGVLEYRLGDRSRWFLYNAVPVREGGGPRISSVVISFDDVTERRAAEREISEGRARLRTLFSVLNEGVILFAADGRVLSHNPAAERILGHPPGTLAEYPPGFKGWGLVHEDGRPMAQPEYPAVRVFASGEPIHGQVLGAIRGDETVWLLNNADPMFDPTTGEVAAVVVSFADITERRRTETALAESRTHLASVLEALHEAVLVFDRDGRTVSCNRSAEAVLRCPTGRLLEGEGFLGLGRRALRADGTPFPVAERPIRRTLAGGPGMRGTIVGVEDETDTFWLEVNDEPILDPKTGEVRAVVASFSDITERVVRERELAESRAYLASVFTAVQEGILVFDEDERIRTCNRAAESILRRSAAELMSGDGLTMRGRRFLREDGSDFPENERLTRRALRDGTPAHDVIVGIRDDDQLFWIRLNVEPIRHPSTGKVTLVVVSFSDITEHVVRERELAESRAHLTSIFAAVQEGILVFDHSGCTRTFNSAAETILRRSASDLMRDGGFLAHGRRVIREDGSDFPENERPIRRALVDGTPARNVVAGIHDEAGLFWIRLNVEPIRDPTTGAPTLVVASFSDITDQVARERELAESRAHLASIFTAVYEGILVYSADGRIRSWNPSAERLLRRTSDELRGTRGVFATDAALAEDGRPLRPVDHPVVRTFGTGEPVHDVVLGLPFEDGTTWLLVNSEPIHDPAGGITAVVVSLNDVTERLQGRRLLEESRARFASIVSSAMDAIVSVDGEQRVVLFNAAAERVFGLPAAEALGKPLGRFIPERFRGRHDDAFRRFAIDPTSRRDAAGTGGMFFGLRADGTEFPFEASISRVEIDGQPLFNIVLRDISERLAAERVDAQLATVVRSSPDAILTISMQGLIETWNDAATRMFGYTSDEAIGHSIGLLSYPGRPDGGVGIYQRVREGESVRLEAVRRRADGTPIEVMSSAAPIRDATGAVVAGVAILSDISERKRKERELAERDQELRQTLDAAGLGVWWLDTDTGLVHCDPRSRALFAAAEVEPLDHVARRLHPDDRAGFRDLPRRLAETGAGLVLVLRRSVSETAVAWLSLTARSRYRPGHGPEIWGTVQDVTEARRAEEAMRRSEASRRLEALGRMTGGIAHDLNNLLTVVSGNLQLLEMAPGSERAGRWVAEALRASESGAALNDRLLTFARRRRLAPSLTDLNDLVGSMFDMLHRSVGPHVEIVTTLGAELGLVRVDAAEIENATLNLVLNARDAMPDGGRIVIETSNTWVDETTAPPEEGIHLGEFVRLTVSDTGGGMTPEVKARAFEPFFTTKEVGRGSGLGLATLHGFAHQSGGFVTLYSEIGHGTAVNLYLPRGDTSAEMRAAAVERRPVRGRGEVVLVVEDDADVRRVTRERLEALGYRVETVENAAKALDSLASGRPIDLLFTDVVMPGGLSGLDLARGARAADPDRRILVTSGFAEGLTGGMQAAEIGFHFLRKPHSMIELADAVATALAQPPGPGPIGDGAPSDRPQARDTSAVKT